MLKIGCVKGREYEGKKGRYDYELALSKPIVTTCTLPSSMIPSLLLSSSTFPLFPLPSSPSISTITTLTSRMDKLETELEAFKSVRLRPSTRHHTGDTTPRYNRRTSANGTKRWSSESITSVTSLTPETNRGPFVWQMPFTVKCIGTFR